jgi:hypothetical protein
MALRSLAGNFSEESDRANLSYSESYSVVNFLIQTYGRDKITALLADLRNGSTADEALMAVYAFDTDGLEDAWRASIGAAPRVGTSKPTPVPTPTQVPTIVPVGAAPVAQVTPPAGTTPTQTGEVQGKVTQTPGPTAPAVPLSEQLGISKNILLILEFGLIGCVLVVVVIAVPIILTTRRHHRRQK